MFVFYSLGKIIKNVIDVNFNLFGIFVNDVYLRYLLKVYKVN